MNKEEEYEQLVLRVSQAAAMIKLVCGVANNAAWLVMLRAHEQAKKHQRYKSNPKVRMLFSHSLKEFHDYERRLIYNRTKRMFCVDDLKENVRRKYGDITDRQYYDFWASIGGPAYKQTTPLITSLWNKYRLSLLSHGVADAEHVAWMLTASSALEIAIQLHVQTMSKCSKENNIPINIIEEVFGQFSLKRVYDSWNRATLLASPDSEYPLDGIEKRNIEMGLTQLCDAWMSPTLMYQSTMKSVEDYDEIFASSGFQKMVKQEIAEIQNETEEQLKHETND